MLEICDYYTAIYYLKWRDDVPLDDIRDALRSPIRRVRVAAIKRKEVTRNMLVDAVASGDAALAATAITGDRVDTEIVQLALNSESEYVRYYAYNNPLCTDAMRLEHDLKFGKLRNIELMTALSTLKLS